ncbi:lipopolysaccharide biosynthesis protein [Roseateles sp. LYH14W]|uniref:Lipopolysaccharide biosynthesis protein n=1 Tax=Pelomonas parva TaxID=3299032 RepID=A0ABW7F9N8_9BURK
MFARLRRFAGVDFHVLATLMSRGWSILAGGLTVLLVPFFLPPIEQGYYYTIASLTGLQILFELGLGQVVLQSVSHEMAHLRIDENGQLQGDAARRDRLASLVKLLRRWYRFAAALFAVLAGGAGALFLEHKGALPAGEWLGAWCILCLSTAVNLTYTPALAFMEGCGRIGQVARLRLIQSVVGHLGMWTALMLGAGLWAACLVPVAITVLTGHWLRTTDTLGRTLLDQQIDPANALNWRRDLLPFQWRIALSALSGYFIFYLMTPMVFAQRGAAEAGRFGLAMAVFNALATVGTSWVYARTPAMATHIARHEREALDRLFRGVLSRSLVFTVAGAAAILVVVPSLRALGVTQVERIAPLPVLALLALACTANCVVFSAAAYMRAHRTEPMLPVSVCSAALITVAAWQGSKLGLLEMSAAYTGITLLVTLPWTLLLFRRYARPAQ